MSREQYHKKMEEVRTLLDLLDTELDAQEQRIEKGEDPEKLLENINKIYSELVQVITIINQI